jgi:hypothetical protein
MVMNEQFKKLSLMAGGSHYPSINSDLQQQFGELIVQECVEVLLKWKGEPFPFDENLAASLIKEHFGIK